MPRDRIAPGDTARHVADLARALGWHHHQARRSGLTPDGYADGFPPIALARDGRLVLVALLGRGRLTSAERCWLGELNEVTSVEALVVVDGDLRELRGVLGHHQATTEPQEMRS